DQIMSISAEELAQVPTVIAVAGGASKACSIRAALKGGYINALVTDQAAARHLLT
ncbi:MAG: sugar-binding transcriptional regulator, partial [Salana multivorans]|nr:sugar-binding transcriptional regulator [Salana multivorans]